MYNELLDGLEAKFQQFVTEAKAGVKNKAAALRARKLSMSLREDLKSFRSASTSNDKKEEAE